MCLICTCPSSYSTRPFGDSLASDSIGTLKLGEFGPKTFSGWVTPWKVLVCDRDPKLTISCYDEIETGT
ncbi:hypothetical protein DVH24_028392 [Malus domestica]|uniref:Uncharacterized protein n=1 Tax=Malus domestica TaxID=3750 RepID=A0A498HFK1_MALDO|nr:hypothetical protein DVH24_028392 [Malus domestica]